MTHRLQLELIERIERDDNIVEITGDIQAITPRMRHEEAVDNNDEDELIKIMHDIRFNEPVMSYAIRTNNNNAVDILLDNGYPYNSWIWTTYIERANPYIRNRLNKIQEYANIILELRKKVGGDDILAVTNALKILPKSEINRAYHIDYAFAGPLWYLSNSFEMFDLFVKHGADLMETGSRYRSFSKPHGYFLYFTDNIKMCEHWLDLVGWENINIIDRNGQNALFYNNTPDKFNWLIENGCNPMVIDKDGSSVIEHCYGQGSLIKRLIQYGFPVDWVSPKGKTIIELAFFNRDMDDYIDLSLLKYLLYAGCTIPTMNIYRNSCYRMAHAHDMMVSENYRREQNKHIMWRYIALIYRKNVYIRDCYIARLPKDLLKVIYKMWLDMGGYVCGPEMDCEEWHEHRNKVKPYDLEARYVYYKNRVCTCFMCDPHHDIREQINEEPEEKINVRGTDFSLVPVIEYTEDYRT